MKAVTLLLALALSLSSALADDAPKFFTEITSPEGESLGKDMTFSKRYGAKLVFRPATGAPVSFEYTEVHKDVLEALELDSEQIAAELKQAADEKKIRDEKKRELAAKQHEARLKAMERQAEYMRVRAEYMKQRAELMAAENQVKQAAEDRRTDKMIQAATAAALANSSQRAPSVVINNPPPVYYYRSFTPVFPQAPTNPNVYQPPTLPTTSLKDAGIWSGHSATIRQNQGLIRSPRQ